MVLMLLLPTLCVCENVNLQNTSFFNQGSPPEAERVIRSTGERETTGSVCPLIKRYYSIIVPIYRIKHQLK